MRKFALSLVGILSVGSLAWAGSQYKGQNLTCTGDDESISLDTSAKTITRNGASYKYIPMQSFGFYYFKAYDPNSNLDLNWSLQIFELGDSSGPGTSFVGNSESNKALNCIAQ